MACATSCGHDGSTCGILNSTFTCTELELAGCSCGGCCAADLGGEPSTSGGSLMPVAYGWLGIGVGIGIVLALIGLAVRRVWVRSWGRGEWAKVRPINTGSLTRRDLTNDEKARYGETPTQPNGSRGMYAQVQARPPRGPKASRKSITKAKSQKSISRAAKSERAKLLPRQAPATQSDPVEEFRPSSVGKDAVPVIYEWRCSNVVAEEGELPAPDKANAMPHREADGWDETSGGAPPRDSPAPNRRARRAANRNSYWQNRMSAIVGRRSNQGSRLSMLPGFSSATSDHELQKKVGLGDEPFAEYERLELLGQGTYGSAWLLRSPTTGILVVGKEVPVDGPGNAGRTLAATVENEVRILSGLNHPNVVAYYGAFRPAEGRLTIVMEHCDGGSLGDALDECVELGYHMARLTALRWARQLSEALAHLHQKRVLHRDLKTTNVFLSSPDASRLAGGGVSALTGGWQETRVVKLGDFGVSRALSHRTILAETVCGTPYYMAPELMCGQAYETSADAWALGVIFFEMITLVRPFAADNIGALVVTVTTGEYDAEALETSPHHEILRHFASPEALLAQAAISRPEAHQLIQPLRDAESVEALDAERAAAAAAAAGAAADAGMPHEPQVPPKAEPPGGSDAAEGGGAVEVIVSRYPPVQA